MLRITASVERNRATLKLEGKLAGAWVAEAEQSWLGLLQTAAAGQAVIVDLNAVTSFDSQGKALLRSMQKAGAEFLAEGPLMRHLLEQITRNRTHER